jgi:hypothetical protein
MGFSLKEFSRALFANLPLGLLIVACWAGLVALALFWRGGAFSPEPVDVVFVFDTTSSMREEIDGTLAASEQFSELLSGQGVDCKFGLVTFGDEVRMVYREDLSLTPSVGEFKSWLAVQQAVGGDTAPENQLEALMTASRMAFRPEAKRVLILITDAEYHTAGDGTDYTSLKLEDVVTGLKERGLACYVVAQPLEGYLMLAQKTGGTFTDIGSTKNFKELIVQLGYAIARSVLD